MNDEELKNQLETLKEHIATLAKLVADQQMLILRMMAHQQAHLSAIRDSLIRSGADKDTLNQRLQSSYEKAATLYQNQFAAFQEGGSIKSLLDSLSFPDDIQDN